MKKLSIWEKDNDRFSGILPMGVYTKRDTFYPARDRREKFEYRAFPPQQCQFFSRLNLLRG